MARFFIAGFVGFALLTGMCCGLVWWDANPAPRFRHAFDIGGGRVLTIWSTKKGGMFYQDSDPFVVYYRVDAGDREVVRHMCLGDDDLGEYVFRVARAEEGRLVCVYEETRAADNPYYFLIFDAEVGKSWPCAWAAWGGTYQEALDRWGDRARRLRAEHPGLPNPFDP